MARDHYAVLGVTATSEDVVIRAAYRALMRRYHPDADASSEAAQRAQAINAAYAVLSDPERRARYDGSLAAQGLIKPEPARPRAANRLVPGPVAAVGLAALVAVAAVLYISPPIGGLAPDAAQVAGEGQAPKAAASAKQAQAASEGGGLCADAAVSALLKAELLRRAASMRGADRERLAEADDRMVVRVESPVIREVGANVAGCSAIVALDLPPGLVADAGRSNLNGEVDYGLTRNGDGALRLASLSGSGRLVGSLATLAPAQSESPVEIDAIAPREVAAAEPRQQVRPAPSPKEPPALVATAATRRAEAAPDSPAAASAACRLGSGWAERTVCSSSNLTALDRQLGLLYGQSLNRADDGKRAVLLASRDRFQERRSACRSETCLTSAYVARLREISDIMARRSQQ